MTTTELSASAIEMAPQSSSKSGGAYLLIGPAVVWMTLLLVVPMAMIVYVSFWTQTTFKIESTLTLASSRTFFASDTYLSSLWTTIRIWLTVLAATFFVGDPTALFVGLFVKNKTLQTALLVLCVIPFWTSFLIRVVAWRPMLGKEGATREELNAGKWTVLGFPTNTLIAAQTWMPSICLPAGFTPDGLQVGMEIVVPPYHEPDLFRLGYAFERATGYRRPPASAPAL